MTPTTTSDDDQTGSTDSTTPVDPSPEWEGHFPARPTYQDGHCICGSRLYATVDGMNCFNCAYGGGLND